METLIAVTSAAAPAAGVIGPPTFAAASAAALSSIGSGFSLVTGLMGAVGQVSAGVSASNTSRIQANQSLINARLEKVRAEDTANALRRNLLSNIASANATFAARGIAIGSGGTPDQAREEGARNAAINIDKAMFGGDMGESDEQVQAGVLRSNATAQRRAGYFGGATALSNNRSTRTLLNL